MNTQKPEDSYTPPEGHTPILATNMHFFSMKDGALFWKGEKLKVEEQLHLTSTQKWIGVLVAIASICSPIITFLANKDVIINGISPG